VPRVFVDTSVLFPFSVMDVLLALTENSLHEVLWTDELLDEWERVIVREHARTPDNAAAVTGAIREWFADSRIDPATYRGTIDSMPGVDPDDHVHSAAAVAAGVDALLTWDQRGFPAEELAALGIRVIDPDTYLCELFADWPDDIAEAVIDLAASKTRPPMTPGDIADALDRAGLEQFPALLRTRLSAPEDR
jgi:predicted nucleic acid-binding protein